MDDKDMTDNSASDNLMEPVVHFQDSLIEPVQENVIAGNQQQLIPGSEEISINAAIKLEETGFSTDEQSQNGSSTYFEIKSENVDSDDNNEIGNYEHNLSEVNKMGQNDVIKSENDIADGLSTLATAALYQTSPKNGIVDIVLTKPMQPSIIQNKQEKPVWCDVGVIKGTTCLVKQFYSTSITDEHGTTDLNNLPDYTNKLKTDIEPNTLYKLRTAAINTCGRGEWSEISAFKTCLPGYPNVPSAVKITKALHGVSLTWEPPTNLGKILEYTVCMAIKKPTDIPPQSPKLTSTNFYFVRVYTGPHNTTVVSNESLGAALIDRTNKPAIIFRIAAKNEKGYGPAVQVRWLQDEKVHESNKNLSIKIGKSVKRLTNVSRGLKL